jgi:hypothetical protein
VKWRESTVVDSQAQKQPAHSCPGCLFSFDLHSIALFAAGTQRVHHREPTQYRYTFVPTGTFLYIHSMSSSVMRMQPCDAEVPIDFWNGVPWIW